MQISQIKTVEKRENVLLHAGSAELIRKKYCFDSSHDTRQIPDTAHRLVDFFSIDELIQKLEAKSLIHSSLAQKHSPEDFFARDFCFQGTGWQSWAAGHELQPKEQYPRYISFLIPLLKNYIEVPQTVFGESRKKGAFTVGKHILLGQFISWLRWDDVYIIMASTGNCSQNCPPVQYRVNRKNRTISCEVYANGKHWQNDETVCEISFFAVTGWFNVKDGIASIYKSAVKKDVAPALNYSNRFENLSFLGKRPGGWESWYNHYNRINEKLILDDLEALDTSENLLKRMYVDRKQPLVFQIDDGWQQGVGQWDINQQRFPAGLTFVTNRIEQKGYIPGLWIAPFIVDVRTDFYMEHKDWMLRDAKGRLVPAGFSPAWGAAIGKNQPHSPHAYFCLDLSQDDVLEHMDTLMEKIINEWGFRYIKLDFLFAGMLWGNFRNKGAAYEWYERALQTLTKRSKTKDGKPVAYLGCGMPFELSFMHLPLSRIGADTLEAWDRADLKMLRFSGRPAAYTSLKCTLGHAFWDGSVFINDPDVMFLRTQNCRLSDSEKEMVALVNYLFASQIMLSDDFCDFDEKTEGAFTEHILQRFDKFANEEFGCEPTGIDEYRLFTRSKRYKGTITLSGKNKGIKIDLQDTK